MDGYFFFSQFLLRFFGGMAKRSDGAGNGLKFVIDVRGKKKSNDKEHHGTLGAWVVQAVNKLLHSSLVNIKVSLNQKEKIDPSFLGAISRKFFKQKALGPALYIKPSRQPHSSDTTHTQHKSDASKVLMP
jgi:hypothetical protein